MKKTKSEIKNTFIELLKTNSIEKIDVKTICNKINIPRQTFYYNYACLYDVIRDIYLDFSLEVEANSEPLKIIIPLVNFLYEKEEFHKTIAKSNASDALKEFVSTYFTLSLRYYLDCYKISEEDKLRIANFLANGIGEEIVDVLEKNRLSKNKTIDYIYRFISKESIEGLITSFNKH